MSLPPLRKRARSGIDRGVSREWPRHRAFIRKHACCVPGCEDGPIEVAHVRHASNAGVGVKPFDWSAVSLCRSHHSEQHNVGVETFQKRHLINLDSLAAEFTARSPDVAMKEAMKNV
jgi:hypothetical protein